jgi:hypothetical protein
MALRCFPILSDHRSVNKRDACCGDEVLAREVLRAHRSVPR